MLFDEKQEALSLLQTPNSFKVLATTDRHGCPHIIIDSNIGVNEEGDIIYLEFLEGSRSNSDLIDSLWFKRPITVKVKSGEEEYAILGVPKYSIISGPVFERYYREALTRDESADLSTVWVIQPAKVLNESFHYKREQEEEKHPLTMHLDHLAK